MSYVPLPLERNVSKFDVPQGFSYSRTTSNGIQAAYPAAGSEPIICDSTHVALIDEIVITCRTNDAATNATVTLRVNGLDLPFHFTGVANLARAKTLHLKPMGNMVVLPSQSLAVKSTAIQLPGPPDISRSAIFIRYRYKGLTDAIRDGDIASSATLPNVASTNSVAAGGTVAATSKAIVAAASGYAIEVLGMYFTGHNYNAATDNVRLGFWDGTTGTFAANGNTVMRAYGMGANDAWAPQILVNNTKGCIQGPLGSGLYIQATANFAGATPTGDWVVLYRKVKANNVASPSGTPDATPAGRQKWWCVTEAAVTGNAKVDFFAVAATSGTITSNPSPALCKILGHAYSVTATDDVLAGYIGLGLGAGATAPVSEVVYVGGDAGVPAEVSNSGARDNTLITVDTGSVANPGFIANFATPATVTARTQLAWGTFEAYPQSAGPTKITTI